MSIDYYPLREPITHVQLKKGNIYTELLIWLDHEFAGLILCRDEGETRALLRALSATGRVAAVVRVTEAGRELTLLLPGIQPDTLLVSAYGKLTTLLALELTSSKAVCDEY